MSTIDDPPWENSQTESNLEALRELEAMQGPFFQAIAKRKRQGRDAKILVTAKDGQTGIGKSNLCDFLGYVCDTSHGGFHSGKTTIDPQRFLALYGELPPGSSSIMEEGEQFDARRSNSNKNVDAAEKWQMARVREIVSFINLPSPAEIDSRFERLADFWINVERRGFARIYEKHIHPIKRKRYYSTCQTLEWPDRDGWETSRAMDRMEKSLLDDDSRDENWVRESEVKERVARAEKEARQEVRDQFITSLYKDTSMTANDVAGLPVVDIKDARIRQIANDRRRS